jgi:hypothetical protein
VIATAFSPGADVVQVKPIRFVTLGQAPVKIDHVVLNFFPTGARPASSRIEFGGILRMPIEEPRFITLGEDA